MFASSPERGSFLCGVLALSVKPCRACQLSQRESPWQCGKVSGSSAKFAGVSAPPGGAVAQRLRGFKSAEPEKTVKRSSRRTVVNLQFFPVEPSALGLKGASSPFFVAPARRNRCDLAVLNAQHLLREPVCALKAPPGLSCLAGTAALFFSFGVKREHSSASRNFPRGDHFKSSHAKSSRCTFSCGGCFVYLCQVISPSGKPAGACPV